MDFRVRLSLLLLTALFSASCSDFLSGKAKKEDEVIEIQGTELNCLDDSAEVLKSFNREKTDPDQIIKALKCFENSLLYFKTNTKGSYSDPDNYTTDNIRAFFGKFLGDDNRVSPKMALEMMRLKAALFGGEIGSISKLEVQRLINFMALLQIEIQNIKPHWKTIFVSRQKDIVSLQSIYQAHQTFLKSVVSLVENTQLARADYEFENLKDLVMEIEKFTKSTDAKEAKNRTYPGLEIAKWMPLVDAIKQSLLGARVEMNSQSKWKEALRMVGELHRFYMIFEYQLNPQPFYSREGLQAGDEILVLLIKLLDSSWVVNTTGLSFETTQKLFEALEERQMLPEGVSGKGLDESYRGIVARVLERESPYPKETVIGLEKRHVAFLKVEYEIWRSTQDFVDAFPETFSAQTVTDRLKDFKPRTSIRFSVPNPQTLADAWEDWKRHLSQDLPVLYMTSGEIIISPYIKDMRNWPWYSLARQNVMRTLSRSLMLGYGVKRTTRLADTGINEKSLDDWYADNAILGVDLKAFDPRALNSGPRSFFEANHFVTSGNGDEWADAQETYEFVNIIFSSGLVGMKNIQDEMLRSKCATKNLDIFANPWLDEVCFKMVLRQKFPEFFKNLPGLVQYVRAFTPQQWDEFYEDLLDFSRNDPKEKGRIETSDLRTLVVILQYIESMYVKFDKDRDDRLSKSELIEGSARFVPFFKEQFKLESVPGGVRDRLYRYMVSQGFACLVLTGSMPTITGCSKVFLQDAWEDRFSDRRRILRTLNQLKSQLM